ncbi:hypothetical protein [Ureaplasma canigenitalium]|uniref:hypothetical protein n=1 Tax=Ureaplasma canigenitalium TaxID=42092 RepID=UPI0004E0F9AE|nr:hypothetical protein [Ureaplasma canigenitalium]
MSFVNKRFTFIFKFNWIFLFSWLLIISALVPFFIYQTSLMNLLNQKRTGEISARFEEQIRLLTLQYHVSASFIGINSFVALSCYLSLLIVTIGFHKKYLKVFEKEKQFNLYKSSVILTYLFPLVVITAIIASIAYRLTLIKEQKEFLQDSTSLHDAYMKL